MRSWFRAVASGAVLCWAAGASAAPTPAQQAALQAFEAHAQASQSDAVVVLHNGRPLLDYRRPGAPAGPIEMMSCTKSLVALGIGRLIAQGKLRSIDQPVAEFYPEWRQGRKAAITLRMLLNHTSGLQNEPNATREVYPAPDALQLALAAELSDAPGQRWAYNNKAMNLLAGVIEQAAHEPMDRFLQREVLDPIGVRGPSWSADSGYDKAGHPYAMAGWVATAVDAARVGQLVLDDGRFNGEALIDAAFVREMLAQSQPFTPRYGLLWWRHAETSTLVVDPAGIETLAKAGVRADLLDKLRPLTDRRFADSPSLRAALAAALGTDLPALAASAKEHQQSLETAMRRDLGPIVAYGAEGYLGQYIVVVPGAQLVAVRQIAARDDWPDDKPWPYGDEGFVAHVLELARALRAP